MSDGELIDGELLRALREAAGLDEIDGLPANRVARIEDGRAQIRPEDVAAYRAACGVTDGRVSLANAAVQVREARAREALESAARAFEDVTGRPASDVVKPVGESGPELPKK